MQVMEREGKIATLATLQLSNFHFTLTTSVWMSTEDLMEVIFLQLVSSPHPCLLLHQANGVFPLTQIGFKASDNSHIFFRCDSCPGSGPTLFVFQWTLRISSPHRSWVRRPNYQVYSPFGSAKEPSLDGRRWPTTIHSGYRGGEKDPLRDHGRTFCDPKRDDESRRRSKIAVTRFIFEDYYVSRGFISLLFIEGLKLAAL